MSFLGNGVHMNPHQSQVVVMFSETLVTLKGFNPNRVGFGSYMLVKTPISNLILSSFTGTYEGMLSQLQHPIDLRRWGFFVVPPWLGSEWLHVPEMMEETISELFVAVEKHRKDGLQRGKLPPKVILLLTQESVDEYNASITKAVSSLSSSDTITSSNKETGKNSKNIDNNENSVSEEEFIPSLCPSILDKSSLVELQIRAREKSVPLVVLSGASNISEFVGGTIMNVLDALDTSSLKRRRGTVTSSDLLMVIPSIGKKTSTALLSKFGSFPRLVGVIRKESRKGHNVEEFLNKETEGKCNNVSARNIVKFVTGDSVDMTYGKD